MPQRRNAIKKMRQDKKRRERNLKLKNNLKKAIKKIHTLINAKNAEEAGKFFKELISKLDRAIGQKLIHKNKAARLKSRLSRKISSLGKKT
ncbi:MAG: 30S ribosomal protein S20 [Candidatus Omnitrophota bacterium]